ncbi:MAG: Ig-like domain repeat protein [Acidobacteriaceae bacterium]|nr:Ig-like domain repeat protein [Acidobacteriaceae bacterium]
MRNYLLFSAAAVFLMASGKYAQAATCPNGSNTTTSGTFCSGTITTPNTNPDSSAPVVASPYPSTISVSGMSGAVSGVSVNIVGWNFPNSYPYTLELMLVSPSGQALVFFAGNCGDNQQSLSNFNLTLSDSASGIPPNGYNQDCTSNASYKPYGNSSFLGGCPTFAGATPSSASCANGSTVNFTNTFTGATPNGNWNVYAEIYDDQENQGTLQINLNLTTEVSQSATTTAVSANPTDIFNSSPNNSSTFTATITSSGGTVNEGQVQFYDNGATAGTPVAVSGGQAQLDDIYGSGAAEGLHKITATYTDTASNPKFETSNNNSNPTLIYINNHTAVSNNGYTFCNSGTVTVANSGNTTPYPQHVYVTGLSGSLAGLTLQLNNINTNYGLVDWKVLLVAPDGTSFVPMAYAGGYASESGLTFSLSDNASNYLAQGSSDTAPSNNASYLPTAYSTYTWPSEGDTLFGPPQSGYNYPYSVGTATFASTFASENLNSSQMSGQEWSLYIADQGGDSDTVGGYCLTFVTNNAASTTTLVSASPNPDITNTQVTLTATVTTNGGSTPVTSGSVKFEQQGNPTPLGTATLNGSGQASITFTPTSEGQYNITAIYAGVSGTYDTSQGSTTLQVDNQTAVSGTTYCNPGTITISASSKVPQQYPSRVLVQNIAGVVSNVTVTLDGVTYSDSQDLEMMLAGPNSSNNIVFWGNAGGDGAISNQNYTIADGGSPISASNTPSSGTYSPTVYSSPYTIAFAAPAPASPNLAPPTGTATLNSQFDNTSPNGYWSFYVMEPSAGGDHGSVGEHCINLTITPPALAITKSHTGSFTQGDASDTYTITVTNNGPGSTLGTLTLADTLPTGMSAVTMSETGHTGGGSGSDWSCTVSSASCTRTTAMAQGETDTITLTVSVSYSTPTGTNAVTNSVSVSGGGTSGTQTANDQTTINVGPGYALNISVNPSGAGTVTPNPTNSAGLAAGHYVPGATVTLTANPVAPYGFSSWSGSADLSSTTANPTTITMNSATENVTANFVVKYTNVTSSVQVTSTGFTYNRFSKQGTETVTVKNISGQTISGAVQLVITGLPAGVTAVNNTGTFQGNPYWTVTTGSLAPGASAQAVVTLAYASSTNFTATNSVYSGTLQ